MATDIPYENTAGDATNEMDFAAMLEESLADSLIERGDIVTGTILAADNQGLIVDVNWKHDGEVSRNDLQRMGKDIDDYAINEEILVSVIRLDDVEDKLVLSASRAKQDEDWDRAAEIQAGDDEWTGEIVAANKGGLIMPFGGLRGFIPASHVVDIPRGLDESERIKHLSDLVGQEMTIKVIEVDRKRRRLVFSQRVAERENREARKEELLDVLTEGATRTGTVSGICDFGAFVDLGGADGLIHISELAWHRVKHPSDIVEVGEKVDVHILNLDEEGRRIGLSLKRLQANPWDEVEETYHIGQLVEGTVTRIEPFGAFISLDLGIEALLHVSQLSHDNDADPRRDLYEGQRLLTRIISIEAPKQRLGLSLKEVTEGELAQWEAQREEHLLESAADALEDEDDDDNTVDEQTQ